MGFSIQEYVTLMFSKFRLVNNKNINYYVIKVCSSKNYTFHVSHTSIVFIIVYDDVIKIL